MGIFSRLGTLIKSNLNDLISKAEDPQKMLNQIVVEMQNQLVEAKKQVAVSIADEKLKEQLRTLNDKIEEAKRKKNILIARQKRAEAQKAIQDTMRGLSDNSAFDTFERMSNKVDQIEAESEASVELGGELAGDTLQQKFKKLEAGPGGGSDMALAELKAKMGLGPMPAAARPALASAPEADAAEAGTGTRADLKR